MAIQGSALRAVEDQPRCLRCGVRQAIARETGHGFCGECWTTRWLKCRVCQVLLGGDPRHDHAHGLCNLCVARPEGRRVLAPPAAPPSPLARAFTPADKALIRKLQGLLPMVDLLRILNDRLRADAGAGALPYTVEQLHAETKDIPTPAGPATNWAVLRGSLAQARQSGVLSGISLQVVEDFSVVFQLTPAQRTHLMDTIKHATERV